MAGSSVAERNRLLSVLPFLLLGAAMVVATAFYLHIGRDTTYFAEEWVYFSSGVDSAKLVDPLNGHLLIVVMGLYNLVFQTIGDSYLAIRLLALGLELLAVGLFFHLLRVRIGPWAALPLAVLFLFFGPGWGVVWGPPGILNMTASSAGFGMLIMLERHTLKRDVAACALLTIAVGTFGLGVVFAVAAAADVWLRGQAERWKRAWVVAIPILLYLIWEVWARSAHPESADRTKLSNIGHAPEVVAESFGGVATALIGVMHLPGDPVLSEEAHLSWLVGIVFLIGIAFLVWRNRRSLRPSFWPYLLLPLSFWVLVSLTGEPPVIDRYLYPGSMFLVLFVAEVLVGKRIPLPAILVTAAVCAFAIFTSNSML
jgi:hypothetical protein